MKFLEIVKNILNLMNNLVWGPPLLILLVGTGIYFTVKLGFLQITKLPLAFKYLFSKDEDQVKGDGDISSFAALCTALSATIGTGNIVGVATAVGTGGPGAILWMWIAAFVGMATKYAEGFLAIKYRECDENGQMCGGPMYYIEKGTGNKLLAKLFAFFGLAVALLGIGTFGQVKSISDAVTKGFNISPQITATVITVLVAAVTLGGIQRISKVAEKIVPFMASLYIIGALLILICYFKEIPEAILLIVSSAFNPQATLGGVAGITIKTVIQRGIGRGIFSNEAGLGSAPIAAAAAQTHEPVRQGLVSMTGTFIDTIVICTMTGLSIVLTGAWKVDGLEGVQVTTYAFKNGLPFPAELSAFILMLCLVFFAFTTILGWDYYSERCLEYLTGGNMKKVKVFRWIYILAVFIGPYMTVSAVWVIADIFNGLMALPNMIALFALSGVVAKETREFFKANKHLE